MTRLLLLPLLLVPALAGCKVVVAEQPGGPDLGAVSDGAAPDLPPNGTTDCCDGPDLRDAGDLAVDPWLAGWPMVHHDAQNSSRSAVTGPTQVRTAWSAPLKSVGPAVVAADGTVYVGTGTNLGIAALSPADGQIRWTSGLGCQNLALGPDGTLYTDPCTNVPRLCAIDPAGMKTRWCVVTPSDPTLPLLIAPDGTLYALFPTEAEAFAPADGHVLWSRKLDGMPVGLALAPTMSVLYEGQRDRISVCDSTTGNKKYDIPVHSSLVTAPAVGRDGTLYFVESSDFNRLIAWNPSMSQRWSYSLAFADATGPPAIASDGSLRITLSSGGVDGTLLALDPDGNRLWSALAPGGPPGPVVVDSGGAAFFAGGPGRVYAIEPNGAVRFSYVAQASPSAPPAIGPTHHLFVTGLDDHLLAVGP